MMTHFNELNTLRVDRDQALEMAIRGEQTRDFTEMNGEVAVGLSSELPATEEFLSPQKKKEVCGLQRS